jgi:hypothetical protein
MYDSVTTLKYLQLVLNWREPALEMGKKKLRVPTIEVFSPCYV